MSGIADKLKDVSYKIEDARTALREMTETATDLFADIEVEASEFEELVQDKEDENCILIGEKEDLQSMVAGLEERIAELEEINAGLEERIAELG